MKVLLITAALVTAAVGPLATTLRAEESEAMKDAREMQEKRAEQQDRAYRAAIKNTSKPAQPAKVDPWGNTREASPAKPAK